MSTLGDTRLGDPLWITDWTQRPGQPGKPELYHGMPLLYQPLDATGWHNTDVLFDLVYEASQDRWRAKGRAPSLWTWSGGQDNFTLSSGTYYQLHGGLIPVLPATGLWNWDCKVGYMRAGVVSADIRLSAYQNNVWIDIRAGGYYRSAAIHAGYSIAAQRYWTATNTSFRMGLLAAYPGDITSCYLGQTWSQVWPTWLDN